MSEAGDGAERPLSHRKTHDRALILPLVGLILLMPPVASIFEIEARVAGIPFTAVYLFVVWALLVAGAFTLARRLREGTESHQPGEPGDAPPPRRPST